MWGSCFPETSVDDAADPGRADVEAVGVVLALPEAAACAWRISLDILPVALGHHSHIVPPQKANSHKGAEAAGNQATL
jgi:hypothetical protein